MKVSIETRDGNCPAYTYRPQGNGPWPAVLVFMDGLGIRPAMLEVGEHFAVYKLVCNIPSANPQRLETRVSVPRRESKSGRGHRGFTIEGDPQMTVEEAARRRDFTINAILYDPLADQF